MAFILKPKNGDDVKINAWNWRPTLELLHSASLIDDDLYERMGTFGREAIVDADTALRMADFLDQRLKIPEAWRAHSRRPERHGQTEETPGHHPGNENGSD